MIPTKISGFTIRYATISDTHLILDYIKKQAIFEDELHEVSATEDTLKKSLFENSSAEVIIGEYNSQPVGFALFHSSFSTYLGKAGIHLVDLYIDKEFRSQGFGKTILSYLAYLTQKRKLGRLEWWCHDWNHEAIQHYKNWGAQMVPEIRTYRMVGKTLKDFSEYFS